MRTRRKKRRKRIGISLGLLLIALSPAPAQTRRASAAAYGVVAGSVFQESGYSLANAQITLIPDPQASSSQGKLKKLESVSDSRGEFAFHVPPMHYIIRVKAKGFESQEKPVELAGEGRIDVTFQLHPESKK